MKLFKKTLALFLSTVMLAGLIVIPATQVSAAGETETRTINLLDLSGTAAGTVLSKDDLSNWPKGMTVGRTDDYGGTRSVVELEGGTKALKLAFDKTQTKPGGRELAYIANYDFKFSIPAAYRPYLKSAKLKLENHSNLFTSWDTELQCPYFLLAFTDGKFYSKINDKSLWIQTVDYEYTLPVSGVKKVEEGGYSYYTDLNGLSEWTEAEKSGMTDVVLSVTAPYIDDLTTYMLIKSLELEISGTPEELDAAEKEVLSSTTLINDFESGAGDNVVNAKEKGVFAANGEYVLEHTRTSGNPWDHDISVGLDSRVRLYDGISFYLYNPNEAKELVCYLRSADGAVAQKNFTASKAGDYVKYTVWFDDVGTTNGNWDYGTNNTGVSLTPTQIASLSSIQFRVPWGGSGVSYYFDNFRYEKHNNAPVKEKQLDLTAAKTKTSTDNGYTDSQAPVVDENGITYSVDGTRGGQGYQGWKTVIDVSDGTMNNATGLKITSKYNSTGTNKMRIGVTLYGIDDKGNEQYWNWGENPDSIGSSGDANTEVTSTLNYTSGLQESGEYGIHAWWKEPGYPTGSENAKLKQIQLYVWAPDKADTDDSVTISDVTVIYGGSGIALEEGVLNGKISVGDNCYTYSSSSAVSTSGFCFVGEKAVINVIPDAGYALVPGSLKLIDSTGSEIQVSREGFRKLNSASYSFTMPMSDVTVKAEFAPESDVVGSFNSSFEADIDNSQLKVNYTVTLKNGKAVVDGKEYPVVGFGALVSSYDVLCKYGFFDGFTVEDIENGNYIAKLSTNVRVNENEGFFYDKSASLASYNVVIDVPEDMKSSDFAVRAYYEYDDGNGNTGRVYDNLSINKFSKVAFGMDEFSVEPSYSKGVNIAGLFDNTNSDATALRNSEYVDPATYEAVASEGFDHVRLPVTFSSHLDAEGTIDPDYLKVVDQAVIAALSNGLSVAIDLHHYAELKNDVAANKETFYGIWEQLAEHYKNYPNNIIFELLNEPSDTGVDTTITSETLNQIQLEVINRIRAIDPDRMIAMAVYGNNSAYNLKYLELPADTSNLIVSVHNYDALSFTHQGINGGEDTARYDYAASGSKGMILNMLKTASEFSEANNIPIWISEFGVYLGGLTKDGVFTEDDVTAYYKDFTTGCETNNISWCVWEFNVGFGVFDNNYQLKPFVKAGLFPNG